MSWKLSSAVGVSRKLRIGTFDEPASTELGPSCEGVPIVLMLLECVEPELVEVVCVDVDCVGAVDELPEAGLAAPKTSPTRPTANVESRTARRPDSSLNWGRPTTTSNCSSPRPTNCPHQTCPTY